MNISLRKVTNLLVLFVVLMSMMVPSLQSSSVSAQVQTSIDREYIAGQVNQINNSQTRSIENQDALPPTPTPKTDDVETRIEISPAPTNYYVNIATGNDSNSCTSIATPCQHIQETINKAASGDVIYVAIGTYLFSTNSSPNVVIINKDITLSGGWNSSFTTQDGASTIDGATVNNGILAISGWVIVENFIVENSKSANSGAIYIVNGNFTLRKSTLRNNVATSNGAGIFLDNGMLKVINSTISGNTASGSGGGIYSSSNLTAFLSIQNTTIAFNMASTGGGVAKAIGTYNLTNSILANNSSSISSPDCSGVIFAANYNIIEEATGCTITGGSNNLNIDPQIDGNLTGEMLVHAPLATSPVINNGDPNPANCPDQDQRGVARPQFGRCDIGSYEYNIVGALSTIQVFSGSPQNAIISTTFSSALVAVVKDEFGMPVSDITVTFTAPSSGASGIFTDTSNNVTTAITNASGLATSSAFTGNNIVGTFVADATATGIADPAQFQLENYIPTPTTISVNDGSLQKAHLNTDYATSLKVFVEDQFSNPISNVAITFTAPESGASGTFASTLNNTATVTTNASGIATAPVFTANSMLGEFTVNASIPEIITPAGFRLVNYNNIYVSITGSDSSSCLFPSSPCATINSAISRAEAGDNIYITEDTYTDTGAAVILINKDIDLSGGWNSTYTSQTGYTIVDGQNARQGVAINSGTFTSSINHFNIINGYTSSASSGAGINFAGYLTLTNSFIHHNTGFGIKVGYGDSTINDSSIYENNGIGIGLFGGALNLNNSTITNNSLKGIYNVFGTAIINNSTITSNGATGIYAYLSSPVNLMNSILANNKGGSDFYPPYPQQDCYGTIDTQGNNIIGIITSGCTITGAANNIIGVDPKMDTFLPLQGYQPLMAGSPAINAGDPSTCLVTDQRGIARPEGSACEIGSYEVDIPIIASVKLSNPNPTSASNVDFFIIFSEEVSGVDTGDFTMTTTGVADTSIAGISGSGDTYTVTVNSGTDSGTIRLDVVDNNSIVDASLNPLGGVALGDGDFTGGEVYTIIKPIFADVPLTYWSNSFIERLYTAGITGGCSAIPLNYCPENPVTRAQMAVFLLKGIHGSSYQPPAINGDTGFADVATTHWAAPWIKQLFAEGITSGCGGGNYCPEANVSRAQMAIFLLKAKHGSAYLPPAATGVFTDVPVDHWARNWIEQLAVEGITSGCGAGTYCPETDVSRAQMAVFLVKTFNLP